MDITILWDSTFLATYPVRVMFSYTVFESEVTCSLIFEVLPSPKTDERSNVIGVLKLVHV